MDITMAPYLGTSEDSTRHKLFSQKQWPTPHPLNLLVPFPTPHLSGFLQHPAVISVGKRGAAGQDLWPLAGSLEHGNISLNPVAMGQCALPS